MHLLRTCHWLEDVEGIKSELRYFRDVNRHEVDFILLKSGKPWMAVEVKTSHEPFSGNLKYLLGRAKIPYAFQVHLRGEVDYVNPPINGCQIRVMPLIRFLANLP